MQNNHAFIKVSAPRKVHILTINREFRQNNSIFAKNRAFIKVSATRQVHASTVGAKFADFRRNNSLFMGKKNRAFKKYHPQGKFILQHLMAKNSKYFKFSIK